MRKIITLLIFFSLVVSTVAYGQLFVKKKKLDRRYGYAIKDVYGFIGKSWEDISTELKTRGHWLTEYTSASATYEYVTKTALNILDYDATHESLDNTNSFVDDEGLKYPYWFMYEYIMKNDSCIAIVVTPWKESQFRGEYIHELNEISQGKEEWTTVNMKGLTFKGEKWTLNNVEFFYVKEKNESSYMQLFILPKVQ